MRRRTRDFRPLDDGRAARAIYDARNFVVISRLLNEREFFGGEKKQEESRERGILSETLRFRV